MPPRISFGLVRMSRSQKRIKASLNAETRDREFHVVSRQLVYLILVTVF
jgi:hypothetical protein